MPNFYSATIPSVLHPKKNEDAFFVDKTNLIAGVFDGMGGQAAGEVAAQLAAKTIKSEISKIKGANKLEEKIKQAFIKAHQVVEFEAIKNPAYLSMGTTGSVIKISKDKLIVGNVGDSRVYFKRKNQASKQLTIDDSYVQQLVDLGEITKDQAAIHPFRNIITQTIGVGFQAARMGVFDLKKEDIILLCSDGVHDNLTDQEIAKNFSAKNPAETLAKAALEISKSNTLRSKPDDITAVVIKI